MPVRNDAASDTRKTATAASSGWPSLASALPATMSAISRSPLSYEGFAVEDATMWAPDGRVLAVARQTRLGGG